MLSCKDFYDWLAEKGMTFFTGVPDSLLKDFCSYLMINTPDWRHIIAANEGNALALAAGYYMAAGKPALVYMQNSGLGNTVNPLTSLNDPLVYSIPALLLVGWRGKPGEKDEPQHARQGQITLDLLETLKVNYALLPADTGGARQAVERAFAYMKEFSAPYALVVSRGTFKSCTGTPVMEDRSYELSREEAIKSIVSNLGPADIVVSTTGMISRELYEYRDSQKEKHRQDFLTVGSMGHASQIALGIALAKPERQVYCLDGDGSLLMHMGGLAVIAAQSPVNLKHVILNNGAHDSVGGQPTAAAGLDITSLAGACGYNKVMQARDREELVKMTLEFHMVEGPALLEVKVKKGARKDLGRPKTKPVQNKEEFMGFIAGDL